MEFLKAWVRGIAMMSIIAGALQLVLPSGGVQKYVRLVVGLAIVVQVITPLAAAVRVALSYGQAPQGMWFGGAEQEGLGKSYRQQLEWQVESVAMALPGVESAKARVDLEPSTFGLPPVRKVVVDVRLEKSATRGGSMALEELGRWLADSLGIDRERVTVKLNH
ncbi:MAG: stage III sporulation protein AF [Bacillota bacterium]